MNSEVSPNRMASHFTASDNHSDVRSKSGVERKKEIQSNIDYVDQLAKELEVAAKTLQKNLTDGRCSSYEPLPTTGLLRCDCQNKNTSMEISCATCDHYADAARNAYSLRRQRTKIFNCEEIFGEPAWDILLDLYVAHVERKTVSVSSACIGSASPPTTGLRWLGILADHGLVIREHDLQDQRRVFVRLTEKAVRAMETHLSEASIQR